ncbi:hypothetical protein [Nocardia sp. NPDC050710]|uniref:hypothetical protein n=1 Tax=Nocardia sp. NPDC050710 TaxID=3157220 RepID=UPI0033F56E3B
MSILRFVPLLFATVLAAVCLACSSTPPGHDVESGDAEAIETIRTGLQTMYTWRPGVDKDRQDAYRRARPWLTDELASAPANTTARGPGLQWDEWARQGYTVDATVLVMGTEHGADTKERIDRLVLITQNVKAPDGAVKETIDLTARVYVDKTPVGWRIDSIEFS